MVTCEPAGSSAVRAPPPATAARPPLLPPWPFTEAAAASPAAPPAAAATPPPFIGPPPTAATVGARANSRLKLSSRLVSSSCSSRARCCAASSSAAAARDLSSRWRARAVSWWIRRTSSGRDSLRTGRMREGGECRRMQGCDGGRGRGGGAATCVEPCACTATRHPPHAPAGVLRLCIPVSALQVGQLGPHKQQLRGVTARDTGRGVTVGTGGAE